MFPFLRAPGGSPVARVLGNALPAAGPATRVTGSALPAAGPAARVAESALRPSGDRSGRPASGSLTCRPSIWRRVPDTSRAAVPTGCRSHRRPPLTGPAGWTALGARFPVICTVADGTNAGRPSYFVDCPGPTLKTTSAALSCLSNLIFEV